MLIEQIIREYLESKLTVPVYTEQPEAPPGKYILTDRTGGSESNRIRRATFAVQSYAGSLAEAAALNEEVKNALDNAGAGDGILHAQLNSDYNFTDTAKRKHRYQAVYEIYY